MIFLSTGKVFLGFWTLLIMLVSFFYLSNLRSSIVLGRYDQSIDTLDDVAKHLSTLYIPMFDFSGTKNGYIRNFRKALGPQIYNKVLCKHQLTFKSNVNVCEYMTCRHTMSTGHMDTGHMVTGHTSTPLSVQVIMY